MQPMIRSYDRHVAADVCRVAAAAEALGVKEFELFRAAFRAWHGHDGRKPELEAAFARYLLEQEPPHWVRHFARQVLDAARAGTLDPRHYGLGPTRARRPAAQPGPLFAAFATFAAFVAYWLIAG